MLGSHTISPSLAGLKPHTEPRLLRHAAYLHRQDSDLHALRRPRSAERMAEPVHWPGRRSGRDRRCADRLPPGRETLSISRLVTPSRAVAWSPATGFRSGSPLRPSTGGTKVAQYLGAAEHSFVAGCVDSTSTAPWRFWPPSHEAPNRSATSAHHSPPRLWVTRRWTLPPTCSPKNAACTASARTSTPPAPTRSPVRRPRPDCSPTNSSP